MSHGSGEALIAGTVVHERYRVMRVVGRGGLGTVYYVTDVLFGKNNAYALKELIDQSRSARRQFEQEAQWLQALDHNHIPKVREYFEWRGRLYLVMDFVDGENLEQKLAATGGAPLAERQVIQWILPICDALQYLHSRVPPILHRDVKPANIIVTPSGHPVLVDLGIAKEHMPGAQQTATFVRKAGTEGYAPPEQYSTAGQTGPWSDVYALGATIYQLLTGRVPPTAVERVALDTRLAHANTMNPTISPQLDAAIYKALAIRPTDRYQTVAEFAAALRESPALNDFSQSYAAPSAPAAPASPMAPPSPRAPLSPPPSSQPTRGASPPYIGSTPSAGTMQGSYSPPVLSNPWEVPNRAPISAPGHLRVSAPSAAPSVPRLGIPTGVRQRASDPQMDRAAVRVSAPSLADDAGEVEGPQRSRRLVLRGLLALLIVAVVAGVGVGGMALIRSMGPPDTSSARATVTGYFDALQSGDYQRAWQYSSQSRNGNSSQADFISGLQADANNFGRVTSATIMSITTDTSGKADVVVQVKRADLPGTQTYTVVLSEYNGANWLIDNIALSGRLRGAPAA